jgi:nitrate/nitrite transporter NarK
MIGHSVCALCYFLSLTAQSPWMFIFFVAMAAFWNDITMGSAWASCIDIGGKYSGIVSGCMNTIGNLGGAVAGISTGLILDRFGNETGWTINLISFGVLYVLAVFLWLRFDATKQLPQVS